jgi:hypothetical protein
VAGTALMAVPLGRVSFRAWRTRQSGRGPRCQRQRGWTGRCRVRSATRRDSCISGPPSGVCSAASWSSSWALGARSAIRVWFALYELSHVRALAFDAAAVAAAAARSKAWPGKRMYRGFCRTRLAVIVVESLMACLGAVLCCLTAKPDDAGGIPFWRVSTKASQMTIARGGTAGAPQKASRPTHHVPVS